jgi:glycosyltransferase involved in cell wall biosynthesis
MPCYNVAGYVEEAVASVGRQTWSAIRLIVVDDGSTDGTDRIVHRLAEDWTSPGRRMEVVLQANAGAAAARNVGLDLCDGGFVAFLDADDRWHPRLLESLIATLDAAPNVDMTFPRYRYIDASGVPLGIETVMEQTHYGPADLMVANPVHSATGVLLRFEAVRSAGPFDTALQACIDLDFWVRIGLLRPCNISGTDTLLADYRKRPGQITGDWRRMERSWLQVCAKLDAAGHALSSRDFRRGRGRHCLYWSSIAYNNGEYAAARRLIAAAWRETPGHVARDRMGRIRTLAAFASLLPKPAHHAMRRLFNARR